MSTAHDAIRDLVFRYADAVCRRDETAWAATWAAHGVWQLPGRVAEGREAVVDLWVNAMTAFPVAVQIVHNGTLAIDGEHATGRWYLSEFLKTADAARRTVGCYQDEYVLEQGSWLFSKRHYSVLYEETPAPGELSALEVVS